MTEPHNLDATVFVYRNADTGEIKAHYADAAKAFERAEDRWAWIHVATLEPRLWIQAHYATIERAAAEMAKG